MRIRCMREAIRLSRMMMKKGLGGPFGAVVVKNNAIIARGWNQVTSTDDPTAHAEMVAIRNACKRLKTFQLTGCELYTSCEPCPMCLGAIYWARPDKIYFACTKKDAAHIGFDDHFIYQEIARPRHVRKLPQHPLMRPEGLKVFKEWKNKSDKIRY